MAKVPADIVEGIKKLSEATGTPVKSFVERLKQIKETDPAIQTMEKDDFKIRYAWGKLVKEATASGNEYYVMPICYPRVREITSKGEKTHVGDFAGLIQKINKSDDGTTKLDEVKYAAGTIWREAAINAKNLEIGKVYKASLIPKENSWGITISANNTSFIPADFKMKSFEKFYNEEIKPLNPMITIEEMDIHKSNFETDIKIIKATITESDTRDRPDGTEYGYYDITDESVIGTKNLRIFMETKDVMYEQGSIVLFGGNIDIDDEGKVRWSHQFQIPTKDAMKKIAKKEEKTRDKEVADIDLDDLEETTDIKKSKTKQKKSEEKQKIDESSESIDDDEFNFEV